MTPWDQALVVLAGLLSLRLAFLVVAAGAELIRRRRHPLPLDGALPRVSVYLTPPSPSPCRVAARPRADWRASVERSKRLISWGLITRHQDADLTMYHLRRKPANQLHFSSVLFRVLPWWLSRGRNT